MKSIIFYWYYGLRCNLGLERGRQKMHRINLHTTVFSVTIIYAPVHGRCGVYMFSHAPIVSRSDTLKPWISEHPAE